MYRIVAAPVKGKMEKGLQPLCVKGFALLRCAPAAAAVTHSPRFYRWSGGATFLLLLFPLTRCRLGLPNFDRVLRCGFRNQRRAQMLWPDRYAAQVALKSSACCSTVK